MRSFDYKIIFADNDTVKCHIYYPKIKSGFTLVFSRTDSIEDVFKTSIRMVNLFLIEEDKLNKKFEV